MCTISYLPNSIENAGFTVTDNRDESVNRPADFPQSYQEYGTQLFYPRDKRAGGTWFGVSQKNRLIALMNGAFSRHKRQTSYRKSRGTVVKELLAAEDVLTAVAHYDFDGIEPFFAVIFSWENEIGIFELIWDGLNRHVNAKDASQPHLWSSAMTYSTEQHQKKVTDFKAFVKANKGSESLPEEVWDFHHTTGNADTEGLLINRGELQTTSVSQFCHATGEDYFRFEDLVQNVQQEDEIIWR